MEFIHLNIHWNGIKKFKCFLFPKSVVMKTRGLPLRSKQIFRYNGSQFKVHLLITVHIGI